MVEYRYCTLYYRAARGATSINHVVVHLLNALHVDPSLFGTAKPFLRRQVQAVPSGHEVQHPNFQFLNRKRSKVRL